MGFMFTWPVKVGPVYLLGPKQSSVGIAWNDCFANISYVITPPFKDCEATSSSALNTHKNVAFGWCRELHSVSDGEVERDVQASFKTGFCFAFIIFLQSHVK